MGTLTGQQIVDRAWIKALDTGLDATKRWPAAEALLWVNDGQREVVNQLPKAYTLASNATLVAGTRQTLAALGYPNDLAVVDVVRNVGGRAITKCDRTWLDQTRPLWHSEASASAQHWMFDERDPTAFYLYPGSPGAGHQVEVVRVATPADLGSLASTIVLADIYANALQWFVLFSFFSKDAVHVKSAALAANYWNFFMQSLGLRDKAVRESAAVGEAKSSGA
jgi:hypothetical protein